MLLCLVRLQEKFTWYGGVTMEQGGDNEREPIGKQLRAVGAEIIFGK